MAEEQARPCGDQGDRDSRQGDECDNSQVTGFVTLPSDSLFAESRILVLMERLAWS